MINKVQMGPNKAVPSAIVRYPCRNSLVAGMDFPVRINTSIGISTKGIRSFNREKDKFSQIITHVNPPDLMMDLSICTTVGNEELWMHLVQDFDGPIGVIPHYLAVSGRSPLDKSQLLERIQFLFESGVSFITIHATPTRDLINLALTSRGIPTTSRGGAIVLRDLVSNNREFSIYAEIFDEVCFLVKKHAAVLNLGTSFRAASVCDGLDLVAIAELNRQKQFIERALKAGVQVVLEGPGHLSICSIDKYLQAVQGFDVPLMPLGPMVTDSFPGLDHYVASIGSAYMMSKSKGGIINSISRIEHTGGIPNTPQILEALDAATVAAHSASIIYSKDDFKKEAIAASARASSRSCFISESGQAGCSRCRQLCPLKDLR